MFAMHDTKVLGTQFSSSGRIRTYIYLRAPAAWTIPSHPVEVRAILFEKFVCGFSSSSSFAMMLRVCGEDSMDDNSSVSNCTVVHISSNFTFRQVRGSTTYSATNKSLH